MIPNNGDRVGVKRKIKRPVSNAEIQIALKLNGQSGNQRKRIGPMTTQRQAPHLKPKGEKQRVRKEGKGGAQAVKFTRLEISECDHVIEEIPENEVNVATRKINLANAHGVGDWRRKNRAKDCSIIIDTGFNGGGLRAYPWMRRYVEYMRSFQPDDNMVKTSEGEFVSAFGNHQGRTSGDSTALPILGNGTVSPARVRLIRGKAELHAECTS